MGKLGSLRAQPGAGLQPGAAALPGWQPQQQRWSLHLQCFATTVWLGRCDGEWVLCLAAVRHSTQPWAPVGTLSLSCTRWHAIALVNWTMLLCIRDAVQELMP